MIVGAVDMRDIAFWIELALNYINKYPEEAKKVAVGILDKWVSNNPLTPEAMTEIVETTIQQGQDFLVQFAEQSKKIEQFIAQAEANALGKENMN